ncbi:hypothetical protein F4778DRAFT_761460 [Xylariomycetidae sp. FL2044]|nr:hypothetical protein F4778DRAFT_761460 [Xylariomycetidae sp. FL2044]
MDERPSLPSLPTPEPPRAAETPDPNPLQDPDLLDQRKIQSAPDAIHTEAALRLHPDLPSSPRLLAASNPNLDLDLNDRSRGSFQHDGPKGRHSEQFDRRFDGPFGRPSLVMTHRPSLPTHPEPPGPESDLVLQVPDAAEPSADEPVTAVTLQPSPPPLKYTLRTRKWVIFWFWSITIFDSVVCPIVLYFGLWYGCGPGNPDREWLSANTVFSIVTAAIGGASIFEYFLRAWRLWKKDSTCRVIGATESRWLLDWFHWWYTIAWLIVMVELIVGSVQEDPFIRLLSIPLPTMLYVFGTLLLVMDVCRYFQVAAPVRISSIPKGSQLRPGIYPLIEDVCAVDGSGGTEYRVALDRRYEASHVFRVMLRTLGIFWAVGAEGCAVMLTVLIYTLDNADIAYAIGWGVPFVWAGIWAAATFWFVGRELEKEKRLWKIEAEKGRV